MTNGDKMKKRNLIKHISLIIAVALIVLAALSSCTPNSDSPILCNVKLNMAEDSRSFDPISFSGSTDLSNCNLYYTAIYKGSGSSFGSENKKLYTGSILLSQGLWCIDCEWYDGDTKIASGSTGDIWVNLNTSVLTIHIGASEGKGSAVLSYKVFCSDGSVKSVDCAISLSKWNSNNQFEEVTRDFTLEKGTSNDNFLIQNLNINNLDSGKYLLKIEVNDATDSELLFTDVLGFIIKSDCITTINGKCFVKKGTSGNNEYIYWEEDPTTPTEDKTIPVGGSNQAQLDTATSIENEHVYLVNPDKSTGDSMSLGHTTTSTDSTNSNRIVTPTEGTNFGINMQGTDVIVTTGDKTGDAGVDASRENTTIVELKNNVTMTLYNYASPSKDATWGLVEVFATGVFGEKYYRRYQCNTSLRGGTLNVVGSSTSKNEINNISNGAIIFRGPVASDNVVDGINGYYKQGAINISTDENSTGGNVVLDGNVNLVGETGISSWEVNGESSSINNTLKTNIQILNGAKITAEGTYNEIAEGIYIKGNTQTGIISITLDDGSITTSRSSGTNKADESGIRIDDFYNGTINITLKNGATIKSGVGSGLYFNNCQETIININIESDSPNNVIIGAKNKIRLAGTNGTIYLNIATSNGTKTTKIESNVTSFNNMFV